MHKLWQDERLSTGKNKVAERVAGGISLSADAFVLIRALAIAAKGPVVGGERTIFHANAGYRSRLAQATDAAVRKYKHGSGRRERGGLQGNIKTTIPANGRKAYQANRPPSKVWLLRTMCSQNFLRFASQMFE